MRLRRNLHLEIVETPYRSANIPAWYSRLIRIKYIFPYQFLLEWTHCLEPALQNESNAIPIQLTQSVRLNKKIVVSLINIGIQYIKSRDYPVALEYMDRALERDPNNPHAKKKTKQLRKVIEKTQRQMREYHEQRSKQNLWRIDDLHGKV